MGDASDRAGSDLVFRYVPRPAENPELAIAGQAVCQQALVSRLEDVKRLNRARKEDEGQWKKWE
jgi:hypothetical protein